MDKSIRRSKHVIQKVFATALLGSFAAAVFALDATSQGFWPLFSMEFSRYNIMPTSNKGCTVSMTIHKAGYTGKLKAIYAHCEILPNVELDRSCHCSQYASTKIHVTCVPSYSQRPCSSIRPSILCKQQFLGTVRFPTIGVIHSN